MKGIFIDTENVSSYDMLQELNLDNNDEIVLFVSKASNKYVDKNMGKIKESKANIITKKVITGCKNSLDIQLISYISLNIDKYSEFYIMSDDKIFSIFKEWIKKEKNINIEIIKSNNVKTVVKIKEKTKRKINKIIKKSKTLEAFKCSLLNKFGKENGSIYYEKFVEQFVESKKADNNKDKKSSSNKVKLNNVSKNDKKEINDSIKKCKTEEGFKSSLIYKFGDEKGTNYFNLYHKEFLIKSGEKEKEINELKEVKESIKKCKTLEGFKSSLIYKFGNKKGINYYHLYKNEYLSSNVVNKNNISAEDINKINKSIKKCKGKKAFRESLEVKFGKEVGDKYYKLYLTEFKNYKKL